MASFSSWNVLTSDLRSRQGTHILVLVPFCMVRHGDSDTKQLLL